jgi:aspartate kinase
MPLLVLKFGGTSVADLAHIRNVAVHVKREVDAGNHCAVVVSAMAGQTNQLVAWVEEAWGYKARSESGGVASALYDTKEYDAVVSSGEQVTSGLLALVLQAMGVRARSWQGWQIPVRTDAAHRSARIVGIDVDGLKDRMVEGEVAVVAGFQGIAPGNRIATLGRGGSDTSAVALAAALKADRCDIYTDVDGVYTTDPRVVPKAHRMNKISYEACAYSYALASIRPIFPARAMLRRARGLEHWFALRMRSWSRMSSAELPMRGTKPR